MEWYLALLLLLGSALVLMLLGMPVALAFLTVNVMGLFLFWGGITALERLVLSIFESVTLFSLIPIPLFIIIGEILFRSGLGALLINSIDEWLGRLSGRLSLITVAGGTLIGALTGVSMGAVALMGTTMLPEMEKRGYKKKMTLGPIIGTGALAMMIPPSPLAVVFGAMARISIGHILIGILIPGLILAGFYGAYIFIICKFHPSLAPPYKVERRPLSEKLKISVQNMVPATILIFLITGVIFLGIASPSEAAATGALGCLIVAAAYRKLNLKVVKASFASTVEMTAMIFLIICGAVAFGQNLAMSGAGRGIVEFVGTLPVPPVFIFIGMLLVMVVLGMFMECVGMIMFTIPLFAPVATFLGFDPIWWAVTMLLAIAMGPATPPFGLDIFVLKGLVSPDTTMSDIYKAALPFVAIDFVVLALLVAFPILAVGLPSFMVY